MFPKGDWQYFYCARGTVRVSSVNCNFQVREFEAAFVVLSDAVKASLVKPHWKLSVESVYCHSGATYFPFWREAKSFIAFHELNFNNRLEGCFLSGGVDEIKGEFVKSRGVAGEVVEVQNGQAQHLMMFYVSKYSAILVHHEKWDYELRTLASFPLRCLTFSYAIAVLTVVISKPLSTLSGVKASSETFYCCVHFDTRVVLHQNHKIRCLDLTTPIIPHPS